MKTKKWTLPVALMTVLAWGYSGTVQATGWYHMPSNLMQTMGWGFGPGYHAPLVLGPHGMAPTRQQERIRMQCAPFAVGVGCDASAGSDMHSSSLLHSPYISHGTQMPTNYPLLEGQQRSNEPAAAPVKWRMIAPPSSTGTAR